MRASIKRGELARLLGCNAETVRYYENIGLIGPAERTASGHRIYHQGDVDRLRFVLRLRQLGFSLEEVRSLLETVDTGKYTCKDRRAHRRLDIPEVSRTNDPNPIVGAHGSTGCNSSHAFQHGSTGENGD